MKDGQFIKKVYDFAKKYNMFNHEDSILIGLSGGADSVCLLHLLLIYGLNLSALYVDHGLRPAETPSEIDFCSKLCENLNVNFMIEKVDVYQYQKDHNTGIAGAARAKRYEVLTITAQRIGASRIALGHNKDDLCETFLINMLRGAGMSGLSGIPRVRDNIIRPFLCVFRSEIRSYLEAHRINYITDPSNLSDKYLRNRIRSFLIPSLTKYNPSLLQTIYNTTLILSEEDRFLESIVLGIISDIIICHKDESIELALRQLLQLNLALLRRVIRYATGMLGFTLELIQIDNIINLIIGLDAGGRLDLSNGFIIIKGYDRLTITKKDSLEDIKITQCVLNIPGEIIIRGMTISASFTTFPQYKYGNDEAFFDYDKITGKTLKVRSRINGDFFYPLGLGRRKKLQDYFVDEKVERDKRDTIPIIHIDNDIVWIAGYRADERFGINSETNKIFRLKIKKLD